MTQITKVPRSPDYMKGVINLRGSVLPVIDMNLKFGESEIVPTSDTCIIVIELDMEGQKIYLGAIVDSVKEVIDIKPDEILPPPSLGNSYRSDYIKGIGKINEEFVMILDVDKVFSIAEVISFKENSDLITIEE